MFQATQSSNVVSNTLIISATASTGEYSSATGHVLITRQVRKRRNRSKTNRQNERKNRRLRRHHIEDYSIEDDSLSGLGFDRRATNPLTYTNPEPNSISYRPPYSQASRRRSATIEESSYLSYQQQSSQPLGNQIPQRKVGLSAVYGAPLPAIQPAGPSYQNHFQDVNDRETTNNPFTNNGFFGGTILNPTFVGQPLGVNTNSLAIIINLV